MRRMAKESVTKATMLMRWPQWVHRGGSTWYLAMSRAQLAEQGPLGGVRGSHGGPGRGLLRAADAVGVLPVEQCPVLSGVADVVSHACQQLEWVHCLEVSCQEGIHLRAVEHGLLAVQ